MFQKYIGIKYLYVILIVIIFVSDLIASADSLDFYTFLSTQGYVSYCSGPPLQVFTKGAEDKKPSPIARTKLSDFEIQYALGVISNKRQILVTIANSSLDEIIAFYTKQNAQTWSKVIRNVDIKRAFIARLMFISDETRLPFIKRNQPFLQYFEGMQELTDYFNRQLEIIPFDVLRDLSENGLLFEQLGTEETILFIHKQMLKILREKPLQKIDWMFGADLWIVQNSLINDYFIIILNDKIAELQLPYQDIAKSNLLKYIMSLKISNPLRFSCTIKGIFNAYLNSRFLELLPMADQVKALKTPLKTYGYNYYSKHKVNCANSLRATHLDQMNKIVGEAGEIHNFNQNQVPGNVNYNLVMIARHLISSAVSLSRIATVLVNLNALLTRAAVFSPRPHHIKTLQVIKDRCISIINDSVGPDIAISFAKDSNLEVLRNLLLSDNAKKAVLAAVYVKKINDGIFQAQHLRDLAKTPLFQKLGLLDLTNGHIPVAV